MQNYFANKIIFFTISRDHTSSIPTYVFILAITNSQYRGSEDTGKYAFQNTQQSDCRYIWVTTKNTMYIRQLCYQCAMKHSLYSWCREESFNSRRVAEENRECVDKRKHPPLFLEESQHIVFCGCTL